MFVFNAFVLTMCIIHGLKRGDISFYFQEHVGVTFLSAVLLALTGLTGWVTSYIHSCIYPSQRFNNIWFISSLGFFYLVADEYFMFHEGMDRAILRSFGQDARAYNFDGFILATIAIIGCIVLWRYRKDFLPISSFVKLMIMALGAFFIMVGFDQFGEEMGKAGKVTEDGFKLLGVTLFFAGYQSAFKAKMQHLIKQNK